MAGNIGACILHFLVFLLIVFLWTASSFIDPSAIKVFLARDVLCDSGHELCHGRRPLHRQQYQEIVGLEPFGKGDDNIVIVVVVHLN